MPRSALSSERRNSAWWNRVHAISSCVSTRASRASVPLGPSSTLLQQRLGLGVGTAYLVERRQLVGAPLDLLRVADPLRQFARAHEHGGRVLVRPAARRQQRRPEQGQQRQLARVALGTGGQAIEHGDARLEQVDRLARGQALERVLRGHLDARQGARDDAGARVVVRQRRRQIGGDAAVPLLQRHADGGVQPGAATGREILVERLAVEVVDEREALRDGAVGPLLDAVRGDEDPRLRERLEALLDVVLVPLADPGGQCGRERRAGDGGGLQQPTVVRRGGQQTAADELADGAAVCRAPARSPTSAASTMPSACASCPASTQASTARSTYSGLPPVRSVSSAATAAERPAPGRRSAR